MLHPWYTQRKRQSSPSPVRAVEDVDVGMGHLRRLLHGTYRTANPKDHSGAIETIPAFRLGQRFIESVNERALDIIAGRAKDIRGYHLHEFRESEMADSPQLNRASDKAKAWRLMLQRHGAGWRLQYWRIPTGQSSIIEFANVCKESEREIY